MPESLLAVVGMPVQAGAVSLPTLVTAQGVAAVMAPRGAGVMTTQSGAASMAPSRAGAQAGATADSTRIRSLLTRVRETPPEPAVGGSPCTEAAGEEEPCTDADDEEDEDAMEDEGDARMLDLQSALAPLASMNFEVEPGVLVLGDLAEVDGELYEDLVEELAEVGREAEEAAREAYAEAMEAWQGQQGHWQELQEAWREKQGEWREHQEELRREIEERVREATERAHEFQKEYAEKYHVHAKELQERLRAHGVETQKRSKDMADKVRAKLHKQQAEKHAQDADRHADRHAEKAGEELRARIERMEQQARRRHPGMEDADGERSLEERVELLERLLAGERDALLDTPGPKALRTPPKLKRFPGGSAGPLGPSGGPSGAGPMGPSGAGPSGPSGAGRPGGMAGIPGTQWKALQELGMLPKSAPFTPHVYTVDPKGKKWKVHTTPKVAVPDGQNWTWWSPDSAGSGDAPAARSELQDEIEKRMEELRAQMGDLRERLQDLRTELGRQPPSDGAR